MKSAFKERQLCEYSQRPKRNASTKGLGSSNGLHWMEEKALKKALYASLHETKKAARLLDENVSEDSREQAPKVTSTSSTSKKNDDTEAKRIKVHAQRKFAQGSNPSSPMPTPVKMIPANREAAREPTGPPSTLLPYKKRPKTEDFLTFLCLRGTSALPPSLDFMGGAALSTGSSSERSSSPDLDLTLAPGNEPKVAVSNSGSLAGGGSVADASRPPMSRSRQPNHRCPRNENGRVVSVNRPAMAKTKTNRKKTVPDRTAKGRQLQPVPIGKGRDSRGAAVAPKVVSGRTAKLSALREKYKQRRLAQSTAPRGKPQSSGSGTVLRSRTLCEPVRRRPVPRNAIKKNATTAKRVPDSTGEVFLKKQLRVRLTRLSPRLAKGFNLTLAGMTTRNRATVGITPHLRRAKMVPPIVDYDSDSEKDAASASPLSPRTRSFVFFGRETAEKRAEKQRRPTTVAGRAPARKNKKPSASAEIARRLLSSAKSHGKPKTATRKGAGSMFRRKTRSLGPVKEYPLVLALPTKKGSGRFGAASLRKKEEEAVEHTARKRPLVKRREMHPAASKRPQPSSAKPVLRKLRLVERRVTRSDVGRRLSVDGKLVARAQPLRRRSEAMGAPGSKLGQRKFSTEESHTAHHMVTQSLQQWQPPRRRLSQSGTKVKLATSTSLVLFSDSDDEPLIKMTKLWSQPGKKDQDSSNAAAVAVPSGKRKFSAAKGMRFPPACHQLKQAETLEAKMVSATAFSEPSPSSLSETIADAAGDPLDSRADLDDLDSMSGGVEVLDALAGEISQVMSCRLSFGSAQEIQSLMTSEFSGAFDENVAAAGALFLGSREGTSASLEAGLNLIRRDDDLPVKAVLPSKADVATNTSDEDMGHGTPEEVSVGTQTILPPPSSPPPARRRHDVSTGSEPRRHGGEGPTTSTPLPPRTSLGGARKWGGRSSLEDLKRSRLTPLDSKKFPEKGDPACLVAAPTYRPTPEEMRDPIAYIDKIRAEAEKFGICRIILPSSFQPECRVFDDMRFTAHNQYIHKMLSRWGPNVQRTACIRRCFTNQGITDDQPPLIGGIELDLCHLYQTVQSFGGIQQVMEKKKWHRVADAMHIPKAAQDRVSKVDDAYCKFVLPYDLLSPDEKEKVEKEVLEDYRRQLAEENEELLLDEEVDTEFGNECVAKGRSMSLSVFSRVARNTMSMWYKQEPSDEEVEKDYWNLVIDQKRHVCVHAGNIDSSVHGSGFPTNRLIPFAKHPWNLKVFTNNPRTILRCMGPVSGVTIPTLHLSMLFTTGCWYRDPHCLPWIEYLHSGSNKIWYSIPAQSSGRFHSAMKAIMPGVCKDSVIWLPSDCAMVPPPLLVENGCSLSRTVQEKGQFIVIFPGAFTSTIACGYSVSESVYFATKDWLLTASQCFQHIKASCEPPTFSLDKLLLGIATDLKEGLDMCQRTLPLIHKMCDEEQKYRGQLSELGLKTFERLPKEEPVDRKKTKRPVPRRNNDRECDICRISCHVSMVVNIQDNTTYCLEHAVQTLCKKSLKPWKLLYSYDMDELRSIVQKLEDHIESQKSSETKVQAEAAVKKKSAKKK